MEALIGRRASGCQYARRAPRTRALVSFHGFSERNAVGLFGLFALLLCTGRLDSAAAPRPTSARDWQCPLDAGLGVHPRRSRRSCASEHGPRIDGVRQTVAGTVNRGNKCRVPGEASPGAAERGSRTADAGTARTRSLPAGVLLPSGLQAPDCDVLKRLELSSAATGIAPEATVAAQWGIRSITGHCEDTDIG